MHDLFCAPGKFACTLFQISQSVNFKSVHAAFVLQAIRSPWFFWGFFLTKISPCFYSSNWNNFTVLLRDDHTNSAVIRRCCCHGGFCSEFSELITTTAGGARRAGFFLKTHDFLQPLERPSSQSPPPQPPSRPAAEKPLRQHALPGGIGTFSISRAAAAAAAAADQPAAAAVKQEQPPFAVWGQPDPRGTLRAYTLARALVFSFSPLSRLVVVTP